MNIYLFFYLLFLIGHFFEYIYLHDINLFQKVVKLTLDLYLVFLKTRSIVIKKRIYIYSVCFLSIYFILLFFKLQHLKLNILVLTILTLTFYLDETEMVHNFLKKNLSPIWTYILIKNNQINLYLIEKWPKYVIKLLSALFKIVSLVFCYKFMVHILSFVLSPFNLFLFVFLIIFTCFLFIFCIYYQKYK